jgi:hypothetical protein
MISASTLPTLSGSEKQVSWANRLRLDALNVTVSTWMGLEEQLAETANEQQKSILSALIAAYTWFFAESRTEAKWWIDNRQGNPHDWERVMYKEMEAHLDGQGLPVQLRFFEGAGWKALPKRSR